MATKKKVVKRSSAELKEISRTFSGRTKAEQAKLDKENEAKKKASKKKQ